jgi:hypothetical protein
MYYCIIHTHDIIDQWGVVYLIEVYMCKHR